MGGDDVKATEKKGTGYFLLNDAERCTKLRVENFQQNLLRIAIGR